MLRGEKVGLRARQESDGAVLQAELYDDVETQARAGSRPWVPVPPTSPTGPYVPTDPTDGSVRFTVVDLADAGVAGVASLWGIDRHNRTAHLGVTLRPSFRGRGFGTDVVRVLCHYGFAVRGLHRLSLETLADNQAMLRAAAAAGFVVEGRLRSAAWVMGEFADDVLLGLLADEWRQAPTE